MSRQQELEYLRQRRGKIAVNFFAVHGKVAAKSRQNFVVKQNVVYREFAAIFPDSSAEQISRQI
jgi:hypothetical protein